MNEHYVSLDPNEQDRYERSHRTELANHRARESVVEPLSSTMGTPLLFANGLLSYHLLSRRGFSFLPVGISKAPQYGIIIGASLLGFHLGRTFVYSLFHDQHYNLSFSRKRDFMSGSVPLDSLTEE